MREQELESLEMALNNLNISEYEQGREICKTMNILFNCFGSYEKIAQTVYEGIGNKAKKYLRAMVLLALLSLAQDSVCSGRFLLPDRRKEASMSFASKNQKLLQKMFQKATGIDLQIADTGYTLYHDADRRLFQDQKYLLGFLEAWICVHPTIQQSIICGFVRGVLLKEKVHFLPPLGFNEVVFPFV